MNSSSRLPAATVVVLLVFAGCLTPRVDAAGTPQEVERVRLADAELRRANTVDFVPALASADAHVRARAVLALARLERQDTRPSLEAALGDVDPATRRAAAFGLGQIDLALESGRPEHEELRGRIERALQAALEQERDAGTRIALIRALGRVAAAGGLDTLIQLALVPMAPSSQRAEALLALGVAGARRQASRSHDDRLKTAVEAAIQDDDDEVVVAATYAAFRQKLPLSETAFKRASQSSEQARIFAARALPQAANDAFAGAVAALAADADWRVLVEVARALGARAGEPAMAGALLERAVTAYVSGGWASGHVVREVCAAMAKTASPSVGGPALSKALERLPQGAEHAGVRCTCAVALDVLDSGAQALSRCTQGLPSWRVHLFEVARVAAARIPSQEKATALLPLLSDESEKVRGAAAAVLAADGTPSAAGAAALRLSEETDAAVASALLEVFADDEHAELLSDRVLLAVVARFSSGTTFEQLEPVLAGIKLCRTRTPCNDTLAALASHADPRVRDAAQGTPIGERTWGPRAAVVTAPAVGRLPLVAILKTQRGDIKIAFERELAPATVHNFVTLARKGLYNNTPFHRVIGDFVAQGGDPRGDGSGGPGYTLPCENSDARYVRGAVGMAHAGKDTGGSQFFLTHSDQPHLDGRYTLFARVVAGADVMDALQPDDLLHSVEITTAMPKP